ncbi:ATP-binding protein [Balneolaceae bacterium ANBcel3]|nr:ATP-binding protein [Balneolaceae bacterium ANBcel3]
MQKETLTLSTNPKELDRLAAFSESLSESLGLNDDLTYRVMLTLSEAVTNAMVHGNKNDPKKKVHVEATAEKGVLSFTVSDEGPGFDPASLPDPTLESNLLKTSGRGVWLIHQFADQVHYCEHGNKVHIVFNINS